MWVIFPQFVHSGARIIRVCDSWGSLKQERLLSYWSMRPYHVTDLMTELSSRKSLLTDFLECK